MFGAGFVLGAIRVPFLVPRLGERAAELIEMPFMLVVVVLAARLIVRRFALPVHASARLGVGAIALGLLILAELVLILSIRAKSVGEYIASRDPVSGTVFLLMLALFALMPLLLGRIASASRRKR